ncbi:MAG: SufD family Fe-S cluster assembly protein [Nanobdellota archaeon]
MNSSSDFTLLTSQAGIHPLLQKSTTAHLVVEGNNILSSSTVKGLTVDKTPLSDGVDIRITLDEGVVLEDPVQMCFGMLHDINKQHIKLSVHLKKNSSMKAFGHCILTANTPLDHIMTADITLDEGAEFNYFERHTHSDSGLTNVYPKSKVYLGKKAHYRTEFELLKGRVGKLDIDIESFGDEKSVSDMITRVSAKKADNLIVKETSHLNGPYAKSVLRSKVAVKDNSSAKIYNKIIATHEYAKGHVDCTEILQDRGVVQAYPDVEVRHPKARVTHEAKLGGVDDKQLETLMSKGLSEEKAEEIIIEGLLS